MGEAEGKRDGSEPRDAEGAAAAALPSSADELLRLHPLPAEFFELGRPFTAVDWVDLDIGVDAAWSIISDFGRLNRDAGLDVIHLEEHDGIVTGARMHGGVRHHFTEKPWEWAYGAWLAVTRRYSRGGAYVSRDLQRIIPRPEGGCRVYVCFTWVPRGFFYGRLIRVALTRAAAAVCRAVAERASSQHDEAFELSASSPLPSAHEAARIEALAGELREFPEPVVASLRELLARGDDVELDRIRPFELAARWGYGEAEVLRVCLHGTRVGLLELSWDVVCPHCRGVRRRARSLGEVPRRASCEACDVEFGTDAPRAVEITFQPHASLRRRSRVIYCSAEPARKRHIVLQHILGPGERREADVALDEGWYRLRLVGVEDALDARIDGGGEPLTWVASATAGAGELKAAACGAVVLENDTERTQIFVIEQAGADALALTPSHLFSHPEFRDLFSEEYLAAGVHLHVGEQTILFTDIVGSTEFYAARGDPEAFMAVVRHFEAIEDEVAACGGAVVKTIGDAAMAAFADPVNAVTCAAELGTRFSGERQDTPIRIRASLHVGPCIAVRLNSNIDYFGTTVNVAAKLQAFAGAGQVALSESIARAPGVEQLLDDRGAALEALSFDEAPGGPWRIYRWEPAASLADARGRGGEGAALPAQSELE